MNKSAAYTLIESKQGMGRIARLLLALCLTCCLLSVPATAYADIQSEDYIGDRTVGQRELTIADAPDVDAECGLLVDANGNVIWSRNVDMSHSIASITKVMTAVVAIENMPLDAVITVSEDAASVGESSAELPAGAQLTLLTLLHGMLIESGNDAAVAIAQGVGGNTATFVQMMNDKAAALGMTSTWYVDPNGLDDATQSTPRDLAILLRYAMANETFRSIVCIASEDIDLGNGVVTIENTNECLVDLPGCIGIKTGTTDLAGNCLTAAVNRDGLELYSVVLGSSGYYTRFTSTESLMEWGYAHYLPIELGQSGQVVARVPHAQWMDQTVDVVCESPVTVHVLDYDGAIHQEVAFSEVRGDVSIGDVVGSVTWSQGDRVVGTSRLVAAEDVAAPNFFQRIGIWFKRLFSSGPDTAELENYLADIEVGAA